MDKKVNSFVRRTYNLLASASTPTNNVVFIDVSDLHQFTIGGYTDQPNKTPSRDIYFTTQDSPSPNQLSDCKVDGLTNLSTSSADMISGLVKNLGISYPTSRAGFYVVTQAEATEYLVVTGIKKREAVRSV